MQNATHTGSLLTTWLAKTQDEAGGQPSLEATPRLPREAAVRLWLEVAQQLGVPGQKEHADALTCH